MKRKNFSGGAVWEDIVGYSRAVRIGNIIEISGTTAVVDNKVAGVNDPYIQTKTILEKIKKVLEEAGASLADVIRTRMFVTDISKWQQYAKAHQEYFGKIKPATSMIEIKSLIDPDMMIEIEVSAVVG
ncbi:MULTISPECIES: RidA family protein [Ignavibacterium]|jgi:enamine deaminase RidA (YjgF/YER057c/UK114 family)|uniref:RidA family protein n=1 Tax=Ignavibacterium TaxID=795750 RepID=UPI0025C52431|nr:MULTISPECIES: RidA family protein [Ignavibacterium]MBI5660699.1 RidA family protein [Ignavibacterium album]